MFEQSAADARKWINRKFRSIRGNKQRPIISCNACLIKKKKKDVCLLSRVKKEAQNLKSWSQEEVKTKWLLYAQNFNPSGSIRKFTQVDWRRWANASRKNVAINLYKPRHNSTDAQMATFTVPLFLDRALGKLTIDIGM